MADKSILDQALNLIPGVRSGKRRPAPPSREKRLLLVQKKLARLTKDVERLALMIVGTPSTKKAKAGGKRTAGAVSSPTKRRGTVRRKASTGARTAKRK